MSRKRPVPDSSGFLGRHGALGRSGAAADDDDVYADEGDDATGGQGASMDAPMVRRHVEACVYESGGRVLRWVGGYSSERRDGIEALTMQCAIDGTVAGTIGADLSASLGRPVTVNITRRDDTVLLRVSLVLGAHYEAPASVKRWIWAALVASALLGAIALRLYGILVVSQ